MGAKMVMKLLILKVVIWVNNFKDCIEFPVDSAFHTIDDFLSL